MPAPRHSPSGPRHSPAGASPPREARAAAADALIAISPLTSRWIERLLAGHEPPLTMAQFLALRAIAGDGLSASELAQQACVSAPAISQLLRSLADAGLLQRRELPEDRRRLTLALSTAGQRALSSAHALLHRRLSSLLEGLSRPEADALARALRRVEDALSGAPPPRRPHPPPPRAPRRRPL